VAAVINDRTPWTPEQTEELAKKFFSDPKPSIATKAAAMGRTPHATWTYISRIGMATPGAAVRKCLPCDRKFYSSHVGNRMCTWCLESEELRCA
jgi:hypothetical protein